MTTSSFTKKVANTMSTRSVSVIEDMVSGSFDKWCLVPKPIKSLSTTAKRKEWEEIVKDSRYELIYDDWEEVLAAARDLSDVGGVETVQIVRVQRLVKPNVHFKDGKQIGRKL